MSIIDRAKEKRKQIEAMTAFVDNDNAPEFAEFFPLWSGDAKIYTVGMRVRYGGTVYQVIQPHTSQDTWNPVDAVSLWGKVLIPDANVIPNWEQPGSTNPYKKGDKVLFNGVVYESVIDGNVWSPTDYPAGWKKV